MKPQSARTILQHLNRVDPYLHMRSASEAMAFADAVRDLESTAASDVKPQDGGKPEGDGPDE